jgi:hypothetical protein
MLLLGLLAGIAGIFTRRPDPGHALACLLITGCAVAVLVGADLYEFSWRYQLPALVTLPVAGAFGVTALVRTARERRRHRAEVVGAVLAGAVPAGPAAEPCHPADDLAVTGSEQVTS